MKVLLSLYMIQATTKELLVVLEFLWMKDATAKAG